MASTRLIRSRIKTTKNIRQITKAMEMVSASKMRHAQEQAISSKPYSQKLQETINRIVSVSENIEHPLLKVHTSGQDIILLVSSDKGLTGGLTTNLFKGAQNHIDLINKDESVSFILVGKKARDYLLHTDYNITAEFSNLPDKISFNDSLPISKMILDGYSKGIYKSITVIYMDFVSTLVQKFQVNQILPFNINKYTDVQNPEIVYETQKEKSNYQFEPNAKSLFESLLPYYVEILIYQILLEAKASEHSARMVAMKSASDNASEVIVDLNLLYNKSRQASITVELLDIVTASVLSQG